MRKKYLFILPIVAAVYTFASNQSNDAEHTLLLQNVEALSEGDKGDSEIWDCWSELKYNGGGVWRCGTPCIYEPHKAAKKGESKCYKRN